MRARRGDRADGPLVANPGACHPRGRVGVRGSVGRAEDAPRPPAAPPGCRARILNDAGVPCGPIYRIDEAFADPQVQHLAMAQPVRSPVLGELTILGHPVSHGEHRQPIRTAAPELGQDNEPILTSIGYTKDQIARSGQARHHLMRSPRGHSRINSQRSNYVPATTHGDAT